jgi:hypothetical protein
VRRGICIALAGLALAGCGGTGLRGTLEWSGSPSTGPQSVSGTVRNTTSHSVDLNPGAMRLLDKDGRSVAGRIEVGAQRLAAHASTRLTARWKAGKPVRIDYGAGTLALPSG